MKRKLSTLSVVLACWLLPAVEAFPSVPSGPVAGITRLKISHSVQNGFCYLVSRQQPDGAACEPGNRIFESWETVNFLLAATMWRKDFPNAVPARAIRNALGFLQKAEGDRGLLWHNRSHRKFWCVETSSEYLRALGMLESYTSTETRKRLVFLAALQDAKGKWLLSNRVDSPISQDFPSPSGFAISALLAGGRQPRALESAIGFFYQGIAIRYYYIPRHIQLSTIFGPNASGSPRPTALITSKGALA